MKGNHRNDQVERFFQHNPFEDPLYLKKYVKEHPDHKMAWYLLGREYAAKGQAGKAAYCFAQSGEIYEAFERQKIVLEGPLPTVGDSAAAQADKKAGEAGTMKFKKRWAALLVLLAFIVVTESFDAAKNKIVVQSPAAVQASPAPAPVPIPAQAGGEKTEPAAGDTPSLNMKIYFSDGDWGGKMKQMLSASRAGAAESFIVQAGKSPDGKWIQWNKPLQPVVGVENSGSGDYGAVMRYYSSQVCSCQLSDGTRLAPVIDGWVQSSEQAIVLKSAILAYQKKTGSLPVKAEQLAQPYPDNLLPGITPEMQSMFPKTVSELAGAGAGAKPSGSEPEKQVPVEPAATPTAAPSQSPAGTPLEQASTSPLQEPVSIVIDTDKHRLALVSGNYILRSYPVGLGGDKTPEGEFVISEKVRNPNGRSNGEFGSRGMTLSDTLYAIHGTNKPSSVGKDESHGCVRMLQADVEELYDMAPQQTKVTIGKGLLPDDTPGSVNDGSGGGAGRGNPGKAFGVPLQTNDSNPNKKYKWLD